LDNWITEQLDNWITGQLATTMSSSGIIFDSSLPAWAVALMAVAGGACVAAFVRRDALRLAPWLRRGIVGLDLIAVILIGCLMLNPKLVRTWPDPQKPHCTLLVDSSRSMMLSDSCGDALARWLDSKAARATGPAKRPTATAPAAREKTPREAVVRAVLAGEWLHALRQGFDVSGQRFDEKPGGLALDAGSPPFAANREGRCTALGAALEQTLNSSTGRRPKAIVLISDGAWNSGPDPAEIARSLGRLDVPVYAVGIGNPAPPRDAAVLNLLGPKTALPGEELCLTASVATSGMPATSLSVEMSEGGEMVERKQVTIPASGRPVNVSFSFVPQEHGRKRFAVKVPPQQGEQDASNNEAAAAVEVSERTINVLLVDAEPRWEFRFIRNVLERDPAVHLGVCLLRPGVGTISGADYVNSLPADHKELAVWDLLILGDVPPASMPDGFLAGLAGMVTQGGGALAIVAGRRGHFRDLAGTPLAEILPVKLDGLAAGGPGAAFRPELSTDGAAHLLTRLSGDAQENELTWSGLPAMTWAAGVSGLARGAEALLVHPYLVEDAARMPLLAVQRAGAGKVMFCGIEETWRWRKAVGDRYHYRFWAQAVRWLVKRPFAEGDPRARLAVDRSECSVGENVEIEAFCLGPDGFPLTKAQVWVKVTLPGGESHRIVMDAVPGNWGIYRAAFAPEQTGACRFRPIVSIYGKEPLESSATLEVTRPDLEKNMLAQDRASLAAIAEASGGEYLQPEEIDRLPGLLTARMERKMMTAEYSPCRHWAYYGVLTLVLGTLWLTRKRSGLA